MPIGPYSPCPGGLDKKIKFCCADLVSQWEKIDRMCEGGQYSACLQHVERLDQEYPGRACLLATKAYLLRTEGQLEEAQATLAQLLEKHPDNSIGLAESAIVASALEDGRAGLEMLERALAAAANQVDSRLYEAMGLVSEALASDGYLFAARALASLQASIEREDRRPRELLVQLSNSANIPLALKDDRRLDTAPDGAPWKTDFDEARALGRKAQLSAAAAKMSELAKRFPDVPAIWHTLSILCETAADLPGCVEALHKFAALSVPLEDAVEAEARALFLCEDPLGDRLDVLHIEYPVQDVERVQTMLSSTPRAASVPVDPASSATDGQPPPKGVWHLFDRATPGSASELTLETVPRTLCQVRLFGRQTDREARLEAFGLLARDRSPVDALLGEIAGDGLGAPVKEEVAAHISATQELLGRPWRLPNGTTHEHLKQLCAQHEEDVLLSRWPQLPLPYLDGKSPQEAAGQEAYRVKLLAAVLLLEFWWDRAGWRFDANRLRSRLGLPALEPIDPEQAPLPELPPVRLSRVMVEKLSDESLLLGFGRAAGFNARAAMLKFARTVVERPSLAGREEQLRAYQVLAGYTEDPEQAFEYLNRGREAGKAMGRSCAKWDLAELSSRFVRGEGERAWQLIEHVQREHGSEPGVGEALANLLMRFGILRPDGTFAGEAVEEEPAIVVPGQPGAEPGKLWTPDSERPAGEKGKLWTPDMG